MRKSAVCVLLLAITFAIVPPALAQGVEPPLPLAEQVGAWVVELTTHEGIGLIARTIVVSSTGDVRCEDGAPPRCEPGQYAGSVDRLQGILQGGDRDVPRSDQRLLLCSDCPATTLTIYRRVENAMQLVTRYRWTPLSEDEIPDMARRIHAALAEAARR